MTNTQSNDGWPAHFRGPRPTLKATDLNSLDPQSQWHIPGAEKIGDLTHMFKVYPGAVGVRALPIAPLYSCAEKLTWKDKGEPVAIWRDRPRDWTYDDKQRCNVRRSNRNILQDRLELICQIEGGPNLSRVLYYGAAIRLVKAFREQLSGKLVTGLGGERRVAAPYDCYVRFRVMARDGDEGQTYYDIVPSIEAWAGEPNGPTDEERERGAMWARMVAEERNQFRDPDDNSPSNVSPIRPSPSSPSSSSAPPRGIDDHQSIVGGAEEQSA